MTSGRRWGNVLQGALRYGILQGSGFLLSLLVVRGHSEALWGVFALFQLQVGLGAMWANWGHRDFLLRQFAERPSAEHGLWWESVYARMHLLVLPVAILWALHGSDPILAATGVGWLLALFVGQSFEVWAVRRQRLSAAAWSEAASLGIILIGLAVAFPQWDLRVLSLIWALGALARTGVSAAFFGPEIWPIPRLRWAGAQLVEGWPFFLLGLGGMLVSRTDVLAVGQVVDGASLGRYQVMMNHFLVLQLPAALLVLPFVRHLYRLPGASIRRLSLRLFLLGAALLLIAGPLCYVSLRWGYGFEELPVAVALAGPLFALPTYAYVPLVYGLYRRKKEKQVMAIGFLAAFGGALLSYWLAQTPLGIMGGWLAQTVFQWLILIFYVLL
jgi:hypothetical protein